MSKRRRSTYIDYHNMSRVLNKKYWPYQFKMLPNEGSFSDQVYVLERWCYDNFKSGDWRNFGLVFAFKRHDDAVLFRLRWG
jgi:hypothetical protein